MKGFRIWVAGRWIPRVVLVLAAPLLLAALVVGAYVIDERRHDDLVVRNVLLDGVPVGHRPLGEIEAMLRDRADEYASRPIVIELDDVAVESTLRDHGFTLDVPATMAAVTAVGDDVGLVAGLGDWISRIFEPVEITTLFVADLDVSRTTLEEIAPGLVTVPSEPAVSFNGTELVLDPGQFGRRLDIDATLAAVAAGAGADVEGVWDPIPTAVSRGEATELFTTLKRRTADGLILVSEGAQDFVDPVEYARWVSAVSIGGEFLIELDRQAMEERVAVAFADHVVGELTVSYDVIDGQPEPTEVVDNRRICCDASAGDRMVAAALGETEGPVEISLRPTTAAESGEGVTALGVVEVIGEFTTFHQCCQGRVTNIHRIADLTAGVVIAPGDSFSVNEHVGRRTRANGFVDGGVIYQGEFESDIGGGISQYATTLFNAAFFGGLEIPYYQSHSIYLDRYPYGREATLSFPVPDLVIHNPTAYAVLIWPTYGATSITVQLYSTATATVTETDQIVDRSRACTRITTFRLREYEDGRTIEDAFYAFYRPSAGYDCGELEDPAPDPGPDTGDDG